MKRSRTPKTSLTSKLIFGALALASCTQAQAACNITPNPTPAPRLRCGIEGVLLNPGTPLEPDTSITPSANDDGATLTDHCLSSCARTASCLTFAVNEQRGECTLYDKKIIAMKSRKRAGTGDFFYNRQCFTFFTRYGLQNAGFEEPNSLGRWSTRDGTVAISTDDAYEGSQSALLTATPSQAYLEYDSIDFCRDGKSFKGSLAYKVLSPGSCSAPAITARMQKSVSSASFDEFSTTIPLTQDALDSNDWNVWEFTTNPFTPGGPFGYVFSIRLSQAPTPNFDPCPGLQVLIDDVKFYVPQD